MSFGHILRFPCVLREYRRMDLPLYSSTRKSTYMRKESVSLHEENHLTKTKLNTANLCLVSTTG